MVNIPILDEDHETSAQAMCDQHLGKLAAEVVQCAGMVLDTLDKALFDEARRCGVFDKDLKRHYDAAHLNPLPRWMALCEANYCEVICRGRANAIEYGVRYGKTHKSLAKLEWLLAHPPRLRDATWRAWLRRESQGANADGAPYAAWFRTYGYYQGTAPPVFVWDAELPGRITHHPQIANPRHYPGCVVPEDAVAAGRALYIAKAGGADSRKPMKQPMRYCNGRPPPAWLIRAGVTLQTCLKKNIRKK